jgi:hypothetical protein
MFPNLCFSLHALLHVSLQSVQWLLAGYCFRPTNCTLWSRDDTVPPVHTQHHRYRHSATGKETVPSVQTPCHRYRHSTTGTDTVPPVQAVRFTPWPLDTSVANANHKAFSSARHRPNNAGPQQLSRFFIAITCSQTPGCRCSTKDPVPSDPS